MFLILKAAAPALAQPDEPEAPPPEAVAELVDKNDGSSDLVAETPAQPNQLPEMRLGSADQIEEAQRFAKAGQPMRLVDPERPHVSHLVGPDLADPGIWRHTELVDNEPWSDQEFTIVEDAFLSALRAGGLPAGPSAPPIASIAATSL